MSSFNSSSVRRWTGRYLRFLGLVLSAATISVAQNPTITEYSLPTPNSAPSSIVLGPDGALWFTEYSGNKIGRITTAGSITEFSLPTPSAAPWGITVGPDGALWFTELYGNKIGRITTSGAISEYPLPSPKSGPFGITAGPDGALWFTEYGTLACSAVTAKIGRMTTAGGLTEFQVGYCSEPFSITAGPDGALWFTQFGQTGRITTSGGITEHSETSIIWSGDITVGPDGALWISDRIDGAYIERRGTSGDVTVYSLTPLTGSYRLLGGITAGSDGALWFTEDEPSGDKIGRITTSGTITEYPLPKAGSSPIGITKGPDGAVWFTESSGNKIGRVQVGCGQPTTSVPPSGTRADAGWGLTYQVTPRHGLEMDNVSLGTRYMAASMNLPYFYLETSKFPLTRCVLTADGSFQPGCSATSRLVDFQTSQPGANPLEIKATYEVDNISSNPSACVLITQDYQFSLPVYPNIDPTAQGCEPSDTLPCARFKPMVSYQFISDDPTETLTSINTAQRLNFVDNGIAVNSSGVFKDCELLFCNGPDPIFFDKRNPLDTELYGNAILKGGVGTWDNFHQTFNGHVEEPGFAPQPLPHFTPGCEECIHVHWRWGLVSHVVAPGFPAGEPIVPPSSNQDVYFAAVRSHAGEEDPNNVTDLVNGESMIGQPLVFWYSATGYQSSDTFFTHGGFFNPSSSARITLAASIVSKSKSGTTLTVNVRITNTSSGNANNVSLNSIAVTRLAGTGNITLTSPSLPLSVGSLLPGSSVVVPLTLNVPATATKLSLNERWTAADDQGNVYTVSLGQVVFP